MRNEHPVARSYPGSPSGGKKIPPKLVTGWLSPGDPVDAIGKADTDNRVIATTPPKKVPSGQAAQEPREEMPLPRDLQTLLLLGIFLLLSFYTLYFTSRIALPIILAVVMGLVLQPAMRAFAKLRVPRALAAFLMIGAFLCGVVALGVAVSGPAADWIAKAPESLTRLETRLHVLNKPIAAVQNVTKEVEKIAGASASKAPSVTIEGPGLSGFLFSSTRDILAGLGIMVVVLFFFLVAGDVFLRRLIEILPTLSDKKRAVTIAREIEANLSSYFGTISLINAGVGIATGIAAYLCGLADPILWGTMAFLLNYIQILGPLCGVVILFLAGLLTFDAIWWAIIPAGIYLAIHVIEGELVTPMMLARRFTLNPVLMIISLIFWYWMWGVAGALVAIPLLATVKIICDYIKPLKVLGHFLGTGART